LDPRRRARYSEALYAGKNAGKDRGTSCRGDCRWALRYWTMPRLSHKRQRLATIPSLPLRVMNKGRCFFTCCGHKWAKWPSKAALHDFTFFQFAEKSASSTIEKMPPRPRKRRQAQQDPPRNLQAFFAQWRIQRACRSSPWNTSCTHTKRFSV